MRTRNLPYKLKNSNDEKVDKLIQKLTHVSTELAKLSSEISHKAIAEDLEVTKQAVAHRAKKGAK